MKKTSFCFRTGWKLQFSVANPDKDDMPVENKTKAIRILSKKSFARKYCNDHP